MLIKYITVENFLPFQGRQTVEFSTDPDKNVTLVKGNNGAGKTSLAQAFEWCLYGRSPKDTNQVVNAFVRDRIAPSAFVYASVEIGLIKGGVSYSVRRGQKYGRKQDGTLEKPSQHEFSISYKENGETKQIAASDQTATVNKLLSSELSHYFFFDGEHVKAMRDEIESGKSSDFADAVKTILGLKPIASALSHLKSSGTRNSVERYFKKQYDTDGNKSLEDSQNKINRLEKKIENLEDHLEDSKAEADAAQGNINKYTELLEENKESENAIKAVRRQKQVLSHSKEVYANKRDAVFETFKRGQFRFFVERPISDAQEELADEEKISKGVPSVNDKTIKFLLNRHECICGTKFEDFDEIDSHLRELLEYVPPKDLGTYITEFSKECRLRTEAKLTLVEDLTAAYQEFCDAENSLEHAQLQLNKAEDFLGGINHVNVDYLRKNLKKSQDDKTRAQGQVAIAERDILSAKRDIAKLQEEIDSYSVKNEKNKEVNQCLAYVNFIYDYLNDFYTKKEDVTRSDLQSVVNKFFSTMYDGELHLELDENYGVTVIVDDIDTSNEVWKTSSGQTLAIILAFILGILDIAKSNKKDEEGLLQGDTYPLVMDAPLSDFDKTRIGTICSLLPEVAEQVIIIIKDTDGDLAEEHLASQIGKRYTISRVKDYDSVVKE